MQNTIEKALQLKQKLVDFVYDTEDEMATALEKYAAEKGSKISYGFNQNLTVDLFITDGKVKDQTPLNIFLDSAINLDSEAQKILAQWQNNFIGLFEIKTIKDDYYNLMNWLTAKTYKVYGHSQIPDRETKRWQPGEIILTIIAPINNQEWFFFSDRIIKGRLSQPKLAIAIGEFRDHYPNFLYADASELLVQAWESVAVYHDEFVSYLGADNLTMPGYKLNQKIGKLQQKMSDRLLQDAGLDSDQSLSDILSKSGQDAAEFSETASDLGVDIETVEKIVQNKNKLSMVITQADLPSEIKQAEVVTVFSHPKWGQIFLPNFNKFTNILASQNPWENNDLSRQYVRKYLENPEANYYIWQQLKQQYMSNLERVLQDYTDNNDFNLDADLDSLLLKYGKQSIPKLPAIASVPLHLNNLFEAAVVQVKKSKSKSRSSKRDKKKGFFSQA
jgi:hypothetical protein